MRIAADVLRSGDTAIGEHRVSAQDAFKKKPVTVVPWNRSSPLSAKNLILRGLQKLYLEFTPVE